MRCLNTGRDTEDYINIDLDSSQNRLFRLDIVLTGATFSIAIFEVFAGEYGGRTHCTS